MKARNWTPLPNKSKTIKTVADLKQVALNAREHYAAVKAREFKAQFDVIDEELNSLIDDINVLKETHMHLIEGYRSAGEKKNKIIQKIDNIDVDLNKYFKTLVEQADKNEDFDEETIQVLVRPSSIRFRDGSTVDATGYKSKEDNRASTSNDGKENSEGYQPGGVGVGSRVLKNPQKFKCIDCHRWFTKKADMKRHRQFSCPLRPNKDDKPFKCTHCEKSYSLKINWKEHIAAVHEHTTLYRCKCGAGFAYNSVAVKHRRRCSQTPPTPKRSDNITPLNSPNPALVDDGVADGVNGAPTNGEPSNNLVHIAVVDGIPSAPTVDVADDDSEYKNDDDDDASETVSIPGTPTISTGSLRRKKVVRYNIDSDPESDSDDTFNGFTADDIPAQN